MITRINLENLKIDKCLIRKCDLKFTEGLNIVNPEVGNFVAGFFNSVLRNCGFYNKMDREFINIQTGENKNDLGYITLWCTWKDNIIKYYSSYLAGKLFSEIITLGDTLIGSYDYTEDELETGILYWDTLGELCDMGNVFYDTKLLYNTYAGKILLGDIGNYIICNTGLHKTSREYLVDRRLFLGGKDRTSEINKLLPTFGFDLCEVGSDGLVYHKIGNSKVGFSIDTEGSGFNHLINIIPEVLMCRETGKSLIIPYYDNYLHPLVQKQLKTYLGECGVNIIATSWEVD